MGEDKVVRAPAGQALVSDEAGSRLHPSGFDPSRVGICAYDLDECTVTLALDTADDVRAFVAAYPPKSRASLCYDADDRVRCASCGRFLAFADLCFSKFDYTPLNEFGPEIIEWTGPCCRYRDSDRSGEASETGTGSTEGESAGRSESGGIAKTEPKP